MRIRGLQFRVSIFFFFGDLVNKYGVVEVLDIIAFNKKTNNSNFNVNMCVSVYVNICVRAWMHEGSLKQLDNTFSPYVKYSIKLSFNIIVIFDGRTVTNLLITVGRQYRYAFEQLKSFVINTKCIESVKIGKE